jgi:5-hydroxyisourate hydrolase
MSQITTHVLDTSRGRPAAGVSVSLELLLPDGTWKDVAHGVTDGDGRVRNLISPGSPTEGTYRLTFATREYFASRGVESLSPHITIAFEVKDAKQHYHIPLLLSAFGYSTYRGS